MKQKLLFTYILFSIFILCSCSSKSENQEKDDNSTNSYPSSNTNDNSTSENNSAVNAEDETNKGVNEESNDDETNENFLGCKFEDGIYSATVNYSNPETGYSATYTLNVEVQDCQIVQINFPNDGYLDEDHISATDLDEDGSAIVDGEDGKTYEIQIDN